MENDTKDHSGLMPAFVKNYICGIKSLITGTGIFYRDRTFWKYALFPAAIVLAVYALMLYFIIITYRFLTEKAASFIETLPEWLQPAAAFAYDFGIIPVILFFGILAIISAASIYEIFGGPFFDTLIRKYYRKYCRLIPLDVPAGRAWLLFWDSLVYSTKTCLWLLFLLPVSVFIPVFGPILFFCVMAWRMGITYMIPAGFQQNMRLDIQLELARKNRMMILGFGTAAYLLLAIPFFSIFFLPGLILGGVEIFDQITRTNE